MRTLISALSVLATAAASVVLMAAPAHAYEVTITITGAGQVTETTPANLVGAECDAPATTPTGSVGDTCAPGSPTGDYAWSWVVELKATPKPGYRFVHWQSNNTTGAPVLCDGANSSSTYAGSTCRFQTFDNLQTRAVFEDVTAPAMSALSGPSQPVAGGAAFTFSATPDPTFSHFECRVANHHDWVTCSSGRQESPLTSGTYTFEVRAVDYSGNKSPISTWGWTVDRTPPETATSTGPLGVVSSTSATITLVSSESGSTFRCQLDTGGVGACSSPVTYTGLTQGSHTLKVWAVDPVGNQDPTPATRTWTVDTIAPETAIISGPSTTTESTTASFGFASESGTTFRCRLDSGPANDCASSTSYDGLGLGQHTLTVWAVDAVGNEDATPASLTWTIIAPTTPTNPTPTNPTPTNPTPTTPTPTNPTPSNPVPTSPVPLADTTAPQVVFRSPTGKKVKPGALIRIAFSEAMRESTVEATRKGRPTGVSLRLGRKKVRATVVYKKTSAGFVAVLDPKGRLERGRKYKVVVGSGLTDVAGNALSSTSWNFRTRG